MFYVSGAPRFEHILYMLVGIWPEIEYIDPIVCLEVFAYKGIIWLFMNTYDWIAFKNNIILLSLLPILCGTMHYCGVPKLPKLYAVCP